MKLLDVGIIEALIPISYCIVAIFYGFADMLFKITGSFMAGIIRITLHYSLRCCDRALLLCQMSGGSGIFKLNLRIRRLEYSQQDRIWDSIHHPVKDGR